MKKTNEMSTAIEDFLGGTLGFQVFVDEMNTSDDGKHVLLRCKDENGKAWAIAVSESEWR